MGHDSEPRETERTATRFEKNRFFEGKLMTARDMRAEQQYHAERLELVTRHTTGSGIVSGLDVRSIESTDDELVISIDPGVAIDRAGRPIVVETPTTESLPAPDGTEIYPRLRFDESPLEPVPVPDAGGPSAETEPNRLVEEFELTYRETPPTQATRPAVDLSIAPDAEPSTVGDRLAAAYHDASRPADRDSESTAVSLGGFERQSDGEWVRSQTASQPTYVYDSELVYHMLVDHLTDTENPHRTAVTADRLDPECDPAELEGVHDRIDQLQSELTALTRRQQTTTTHLLGKTLDTTARRFGSTADSFADHSGAVSKTAREIARQAETASHTDVHTDSMQYLSTVRELYPSLVEFGDQLSGAASETTATRYLDRVADLQSTLERDQPAVEAAIALDEVAEAAADLDVLYPATEAL